jgi:mono/diheme cytochrome c family protein
MLSKPTLLTIAGILSCFISFSQVNNPWIVPDEYKEMVNPEEADKTSVSIGKSLYAKHCKTCHGKNGNGDGMSSKTLNADPSDLTLDDIDVQKDGEVYYNIVTGREEMPAFESLIEEEDIWHLINYIRTFYKEN